MITINDRLDSIKRRVHTLSMATDPFTLLRYRRKEISAEVHELRARLGALEAEDVELAAAQAVIERFGKLDEPEVETDNETAGKPEGTPTTPNMILALLREAEAQGKPGLEPREMQIAISKRWWPTVKSEDVGPTAWRMWKASRLQKDGSLYMLPKNESKGFAWTSIRVTPEGVETK